MSEKQEQFELCPNCKKELLYYTIVNTSISRYEIQQRRISGHCQYCGQYCEVEQAQKNNQWITIRYRFYKWVPKAWHQVNDLPVPPVIAGPAKEYDTEVCNA